MSNIANQASLQPAILSIDQGTTSSRAIVFAPDATIIATDQQEFAQIYPNDGWVEHDPEEIWETTISVCNNVILQAEQCGFNIAGIGITNQRETTLVWDRQTGVPIYNAIVWQDRRTASICEQLTEQGVDVNSMTGLRVDPYFSATKIAWILDQVEGARERAEQGKLAFGTVDTFLIWRLTGGRSHMTDTTNASRTNLFNLHTLEWDNRLLDLFNVPPQILPEVKQSADDFGSTHDSIFGRSIPICGVAGDQQAALVGQCCFAPGSLKSTYGTGCFALVNTGEKALFSENKLLTTVAYSINGETHYALEGSIFIAGAAVQWLRDGIKVITHAAETQALAETVEDSHGVVLVPAFAGLGAPYWDPYARGSVFGMTRATTEAHLVRATLESVCYQTFDLLRAMENDGIAVNSVRVDGGMVANDWLCSCLADVVNQAVIRPQLMETTALGAAYLAGLQLGLYKNLDDIQNHNPVEKIFSSSMHDKARSAKLERWQTAVEATQHFAKVTRDTLEC